MDRDVQFLRAQMQTKNVGIGLVLTLFGGGFGMFYVSIILGLIFSVIEIFLLILSLFTVGLVFVFVLIPFHLFCVTLALIIIKIKNNQILNSLS